ncbi:MAG: hypothetical protein ACREJ3_08155, partial [Polyangiaceae bacterium]
VHHPYWHWMYAKLLGDHGGPIAALPQLLLALPTAEKMSPRPGWLAEIEFATAEALRKVGRKPEAIAHYQRFIELATINSPDLLDARNALAQLTGSR